MSENTNERVSGVTLADLQDEFAKHAESWDRQRERLTAEVERLKAAAKPAVDYAMEKTYTLDYSDLETHCVRLAVRDLRISEAEVERIGNFAERGVAAEAAAVRQLEAELDAAEAERDRARSLAATLEAQLAQVEALQVEWMSREGWFDASMDAPALLIADKAYVVAGKRLHTILHPEGSA